MILKVWQNSLAFWTNSELTFMLIIRNSLIFLLTQDFKSKSVKKVGKSTNIPRVRICKRAARHGSAQASLSRYSLRCKTRNFRVSHAVRRASSGGYLATGVNLNDWRYSYHFHIFTYWTCLPLDWSKLTFWWLIINQGIHLCRSECSNMYICQTK